MHLADVEHVDEQSFGLFVGGGREHSTDRGAGNPTGSTGVLVSAKWNFIAHPPTLAIALQDGPDEYLFDAANDRAFGRISTVRLQDRPWRSCDGRRDGR